MPITLGIDLGTSSIKAMLLDTEGQAIGIAAQDYTVSIPHSGYAEQSPDLWWESAAVVLHRLNERFPDEFARIEAIGLSGQMHGLVVVGKDGRPLRMAILWLDQRSKAQVQMVRQAFSPEITGSILHNQVFPGFAFPSLLWLKDNEPEVYRQIACILLPKDYLRYCLTGTLGTDDSDASATGMFDPGRRCWSAELIDYFGLRPDMFPDCGKASEIAGRITGTASRLTGLRQGIPVVFGGGDQPVQSIGNGLICEGDLVCNIGTGGQITCFSKTDVYDKALRTHTFCHALPDAYTVFGATLAGGLSLNWLSNKLLHTNDYQSLSQSAGQIPAGSNGLVYLPYLCGERTPHMDSEARGMFFGLTLGMDDRHFVRAVMEGVVYSLKDCLRIFKEMGIYGKRLIASGGGANSPLWLQMQADILGMEVHVCKVKEQACLGACILAAIGAGIYPSAEAGCVRHVDFEERVYRPDPQNDGIYQTGYFIYQQLYRQTSDLMHK